MRTRAMIALCLLTGLAACGGDDASPPADDTPTAPRDGLVAEYLFSGNARDSQGSNDGVPTGSPSLTIDRFGRADRACALDGVDDQIVTARDQFVSGENVSVSLWFKVPSTTAAFRYLGTYDGTTIRCYLDGAAAGVTTHAGSIADPDYLLTFGYFNHSYWAGDLDDVRIYNRTISDVSEISDLYHEGGYDPGA